MPIRALVFDLFDTLVDLRWETLPSLEHRGRKLPATARTIHERIRRSADVGFDDFLDALEEGSRAFAESHYRKGREVSTQLRFRTLLERLEIDEPPLVDELSELHMGVLRSGVEVLDHHRAVLEDLGRERRLALCSNFSHSQTALAVLDQAGLRELLDPAALIVSDAFGWRKPRSEIFEEILRRLELPAEECLHVGDSLRADVGGAAPLGIGTVWLTRRIPEPERALSEHEGPKPDHVIRDLAELPDLVASLA